MTAIRHTLQRDVFLPNDERLIGVVHVSKAGKKKKVSFLCATVTTDQPAQVCLHKVKKTDKDAYKKRQSWPLAELKICDGKDPKTDVPDFDLHFEKVYKWIASNVAEKNAFMSSLWKLSQRYLKQLKKPDFINVKPALLEEYLSLDQAKVAQSEDDLNNEDYQALSGREEADLERMMAECEFAIGNAEAFIERLANDLSVLDGANIHSIIESQQEVARLMFLLDDSLREVNKVDSSLDEYDKMLEGVRVHMEIMEQKDSMIQIQSQNHGQLLSGVETIMQKLDMPHQQQLALLDRDLGSPKGIMDCTAAAQVLQEKMDAELLPGLGKMRAVVEQRELLTNLQEKFAQRLAIHLNNVFIQQGADMSEMMHTLGNRLTLPKHFTFHRDLIPYAELMQWLRKADRTSFQQLGKIYTDNLKKVYERELKDFFERARQAVMMKGKTADIKKYGLKGDKGSTTPEPSRGGARTKTGTPSLQEFSANLKAAETDLNEKQKFDMVFTQLLNEIQPMCNSEQDFCTKFFGYGLDTEGVDAEFFPMADQVDGGSFSRYKKHEGHEERKGVAFALNPELSEVDGKLTTHGMRKVMGELFQCLEPEFKSFVTFSERMDNFNSVYMLVRISPHVMSSETQAKSASYFSIIMANCLVEVKRNFDKYMDNLIRSVEETRISKKSKCGILPFVKEFETFACQAESVFKGSDLRGNLDKAYAKLALAQFRIIHRVALEHQKTPSDVIIFENFHHVHDVLSRLKITCLESERKEAKQQYQDHLQSYVRDSLGRPMEKLNHFFEGIQVLVSQGVKEEEVGYQIQFSKQELRKIIKEYPQKEVKKNLDNLIKKVEKTLCEEENLIQVVWRMMQEDFIRQYKHIETMIGRCYPGSKIFLEFTIQDVLQFFTDIAQSH
ncbi:exocyst complex component 1 isoform X2 [Strongylocentrotus purpuratus]|uniref:Exocyst complex component 1 n=1 Tax=Strongylocentrotus purpuratus TaxID=7668 RepID=A0A7M7NI68_STRPU|nr:exocyst complex component 1 isoform X1 [Strongylocentrotus purpuratus]XP_030836968.1 exocyst complex component 1 isoform X2 [Strongylocentrotus purpuratus]|eukprot:XP_011668571.1 PREDICTED: exocyst complex component 1 isoform X1 [Strongylocentrotus purpuratus]